jgi:hypothetical protein
VNLTLRFEIGESTATITFCDRGGEHKNGSLFLMRANDDERKGMEERVRKYTDMNLPPSPLAVLVRFDVDVTLSEQPDAAWMTEQAQAFLAQAKAQNLPVVVLRNRDSKYTAASFDNKLKAAGVRVTKVGYRAPNMNAYVERFVQAIEQECLDQFIIFGTGHFDHVCKEYVEHYHTERPHQAMGNAPLIAPSSPAPGDRKVVCRERLGGVLRHYYREAA